jgi:hypothetical protein
MHDTLLVQLSDRQYNLDRVKLNSLLVETLLRLEHLIEFTSPHKGHDKVQPRLRLEQELHAHQEGVICSKQNFFLQLSRLNLVKLNQHILPNDFHCVFLPGRVQFR